MRGIQLLGWLAVFASAFCFYLATAVIRMAIGKVDLAPSYFVFSRFLLGFFVVMGVLLIRRKGPKPVRYDLLVGRTLANCTAVFCFYQAVELTTLAEANILNMTYPVFITLYMWLFVKDQRDRIAEALVFVAFLGIWLILAPERMGLQWGNLWGLGSGLSAAFAIVYLNRSREYHDTETILFYVFGLGAVIIYLLFYRQIHFPDSLEFLYLLACSATGILGQFLMTAGFRYVTAVEGSIISSTRILLAALLGPLLVADPALPLAGWLGAMLIFLANAVLAVRKARHAKASSDRGVSSSPRGGWLGKGRRSGDAAE